MLRAHLPGHVRTHHAHGTVGEVEDAGPPVDDHQALGGERVERAEPEAEEGEPEDLGHRSAVRVQLLRASVMSCGGSSVGVSSPSLIWSNVTVRLKIRGNAPPMPSHGVLRSSGGDHAAGVDVGRRRWRPR